MPVLRLVLRGGKRGRRGKAVQAQVEITLADVEGRREELQEAFHAEQGEQVRGEADECRAAGGAGNMVSSAPESTQPRTSRSPAGPITRTVTIGRNARACVLGRVPWTVYLV